MSIYCKAKSIGNIFSIREIKTETENHLTYHKRKELQRSQTELLIEKMTRDEIFDKLNEIFREYFDDETIELQEETTAEDIEDWDSLEHINLIVTIENEFGMKFTMGEVTTMKNVGAMVDIIADRI